MATTEELHCLLGAVRPDFPNHLPPTQIAQHHHTKPPQTTIWDTGAMTSSVIDEQSLYNPRQVHNTFVKGINGISKPILLSGTAKPFGWAQNKTIPVFHIPGSPYNILSLSQVSKLLDAHAYCNADEAFLWTKDGVLAHAKVVNNLYVQQDSVDGITLDYIIHTIVDSLPDRYETDPTTHTLLLGTSHSLETLRQIHDSSNHTALILNAKKAIPLPTRGR